MDLTKGTQLSRIGFYYFPDKDHFSLEDLEKWMPELDQLGASWLVVQASVSRMIPEIFLSSLIDLQISPILHFIFKPEQQIETRVLHALLAQYAEAGVRHAVFYDSPNSRTQWSNAGWSQSDLVERFVEVFIPAANLAVEVGIQPVFPPLEPGGHYWDTAFLSSSIQAIIQRNEVELLKKMA